MSELITGLTQQDPAARPTDAHAALALLTERPAAGRSTVRTRSSARASTSRQKQKPTKRLLISSTERRAQTNQTRNRVIAISALIVAVVGTALTIATAGGGSVPRSTTAAVVARPYKAIETAYANGKPTIDQQLLRLATGVRRAAAP